MVRRFPLVDILQVTSGIMMPRNPGGGLRLVGYLLGDEGLPSHVELSAGIACQPYLLRQLPQLEGVIPEPHQPKEYYLKWLAAQERRFGEYLPVSPLSGLDLEDAYSRIDFSFPVQTKVVVKF